MQNRSIFGEIRGSSYCPNLLSVERSFEYVTDLFLESTIQKRLVLAVKFVTLMAQRSLANIAVLKVRGKFMIISSQLVKRCLLLRKEDATGLKTDSSL